MNHTNFDNLDINNDILKGVYLYGFKKPSKIQIKGIQSINTGRDCILQSQSGTGKTGTYLLGVLNRMKYNNICQTIIITPTRELASQVFNVAKAISKYSKFKLALCIGGTNVNDNLFDLKKTNLVIGTLGRINHEASGRVLISSRKRFVRIAAAAGTIFLGGLAWKVQQDADKQYERYLHSGDPQERQTAWNRTRELDQASGWMVVGSQLFMQLLIYTYIDDH